LTDYTDMTLALPMVIYDLGALVISIQAQYSNPGLILSSSTEVEHENNKT